MKNTWSLIFFIFAIIEYIYYNKISCGSEYVTGQMWFMWFCMSLASVKYK